MNSTIEQQRSISKGKKKGISVSLTPSKTPSQKQKQSSMIMSSVSIIQDQNHVNEMHNFSYIRSSLSSSPVVKFSYMSPGGMANANINDEVQEKKYYQPIRYNNHFKVQPQQNKIAKQIKYKIEHDSQTLMLIKDQFNIGSQNIQHFTPSVFSIVQEIPQPKPNSITIITAKQGKKIKQEQKQLKEIQNMSKFNVTANLNAINNNSNKIQNKLSNNIKKEVKNVIEQKKIQTNNAKKQKNFGRLKEAEQKLLQIIRVCDEGI